VSERWLNFERLLIASSLTDDDLKVRGSPKIDDDDGEGPRAQGHPRPP
jgi:hypothetical protein